jgi:hypothetical protein
MASGQQPTNPSGAEPLAINGTDFGHPTKPTRRVLRRPTVESSGGTSQRSPRSRQRLGSIGRPRLINWQCGCGTFRVGAARGRVRTITKKRLVRRDASASDANQSDNPLNALAATRTPLASSCLTNRSKAKDGPPSLPKILNQALTLTSRCPKTRAQ